jgi:hypothetical protein
VPPSPKAKRYSSSQPPPRPPGSSKSTTPGSAFYASLADFSLQDLFSLHGEERRKYLEQLAVVIEFNIVGFMTKETMAAAKFGSFISFIHFIISLFIPDFPPFKYIKSFNFFEEILADVSKKLVYDDWLITKLFSIALDFFTASDQSSQLGTHLRIFSPDWVMREVLLSVRQVEPEGEKAATTLEKLREIVEQCGGDWQHMVNITADGAKGNVGKDEGLFMRIAREIAHIHVQQCMAHLFVCVCYLYLYWCICLWAVIAHV